MTAPKEKIYGIADKAWHPVVGCDPHMPCAPRCWARKTIARVCECQGDKVRDVFQIALTPDKQKWSGVVSLDEAHLNDPLKWRKSALIATGFHGDIGRLPLLKMADVFTVTMMAEHHRYLMLTKQPDAILSYVRVRRYAYPLKNVSIGCSVMNQSEADRTHEPMAQIAAMGWNTHVWYEPALGPVNWTGWSFLGGIIAGGESGANSRPARTQWFRDTRDWCESNGVPFHFKQWGNFCDWDNLPQDTYRELDAAGMQPHDSPHPIHLTKKRAGRLLDGRTWDGIPRFGEVRA